MEHLPKEKQEPGIASQPLGKLSLGVRSQFVWQGAALGWGLQSQAEEPGPRSSSAPLCPGCRNSWRGNLVANMKDGLEQPQLDAGTQPGLCSAAHSFPCQGIRNLLSFRHLVLLQESLSTQQDKLNISLLTLQLKRVRNKVCH